MHIPTDMVLQTKRCHLRLRSSQDDSLVFSATRYPEFNRGLPWNAPTDIRELQGKHVKSRTSWLEGSAYNFTVVAADGDTQIGMISIRRLPETDSSWDLGYWIHPRFQEQGYATEAIGAVVGFAFSSLGASTISAQCATWNIASQRVLEKNGFQGIGSTPKGFLKNGQWVPEKIYSITEDSYREN